MYAITGITGQVGGEVARTLLKTGHSVRAVVRDPRKSGIWTDLGCDVAVSDMNDVVALAAAFSGASGVFVLLPPVFDPSPDFQRRADCCRTAASFGRRPSRKGCLHFDNRCTSEAGKPADAVEPHGAIAERFADPDHLPTARLVHGELQLGRHRGTR